MPITPDFDADPPEPQSVAPAPEVPRDTTPTWELEMLVSGVVIFGLFQLPPILDHAFDVLLPRFAGGAAQLISAALTLSETIVFALATTFVVHLVARTYWVALVGLDSVYPDGVRWDRLRRGPIFREIIRKHQPPLPRRIAAVDNFCSVIFAFGFLAAAMVVFGVVLTTGATVLSLAISRAFFGGRPMETLPVILLVLFGLTLLLLMRIDRQIGGTLAPHDWRARILRGGLILFHRSSGQTLYGPILNTLMSNVGRKLLVPVLLGLVTLSGAAVAVRRGLSAGSTVAGSYSYVTDAAPDLNVDFRSYADQRLGEAAHAAVPFIQSDMIRDPYVRLFIPYLPARDNPMLERCVGTSGSERSRASSALRCLAKLHAVEVDGHPLPDLDFRFYTDPASGLVGIVTYIPVAGLARGRNVLSLEPSPEPPGDEVSGAPGARTEIPFWL